MFKKTSAIEDKIKRVEKELEMINADLKALSKTVADPKKTLPRLKSKSSMPLPESVPAESFEQDIPKRRSEPQRHFASKQTKPRDFSPEPSVKKKSKERPLRDERFIDYLSSSMPEAAHTRKERALQRNKALFVLALAGIVLFLLLYNKFK